MSDASDIPGNVFDPTSSASMTAYGIVIAAIVSLICAGYTMAKYEGQRGNQWYQYSMSACLSGIALFAGGLYVAFAYD